MFDSSSVGLNDYKDTITIETEKNLVFVEKKGPHSFWYISFRRGAVPDNLKGSYTSKELALQKVYEWVRSKDQNIVTITD